MSKRKPTMRFVIDGRLPSLNDYTAANRRNKWAGNKMKQDAESHIIGFIPDERPDFNFPVHITVTWYEKNQRRDADNVQFGIKFIQDALVSEGVLVDDSRKYVSGSSHFVETDKEHPRIEVVIS